MPTRRRAPYRILLPLANPRTARDLVRIGAGVRAARQTEMTALGIVEVPEGDSLSEGAGEDEGLYSLILANPPFAGSLDYESTAQNLLRVAKTKKTELLFVALFLRHLRLGRAAAGCGRRRGGFPARRGRFRA